MACRGALYDLEEQVSVLQDSLVPPVLHGTSAKPSKVFSGIVVSQDNLTVTSCRESQLYSLPFGQAVASMC